MKKQQKKEEPPKEWEWTPEKRVECLVYDLNVMWSFMRIDRYPSRFDNYPSNNGMEYCQKYRATVSTISKLGGTVRRFEDGSHEISILGVTVHSKNGLF